MRRVSFAVVRDEPPIVYVASDADVLGRVLAVKLISQSRALLDRRWADALSEWIELKGRPVDVYDDEELWEDASLTDDGAAFELQFCPLFLDRPRS